MPDGRDQEVWKAVSPLVGQATHRQPRIHCSDSPGYACGADEWREKWNLPFLSLPRQNRARPWVPSRLCQEFERFKSSLLPGMVCLPERLALTSSLCCPGWSGLADGCRVKAAQHHGPPQTTAWVPHFRHLRIQVLSFPSASSQGDRNSDRAWKGTRSLGNRVVVLTQHLSQPTFRGQPFIL